MLRQVQALDACDENARSLSEAVSELDSACAHGNTCPPSVAASRLLNACTIHKDMESWQKLSNLLHRAQVLPDSDLYRKLSESHNYLSAHEPKQQQPKPS